MVGEKNVLSDDVCVYLYVSELISLLIRLLILCSSSSVGDFPSPRCGPVAMVTRAPAAGRAPQ